MSKWSSSPAPEGFGSVLLVVMCVAFLYIAVAETRYRFAHPELTETQLLLKFFDAMVWN